MARWRQVKDTDTGEYVLVPLDATACERDERLGIYVQPDFKPIVSPIDGTTINSARQYEDHCRRHNVVPMQAFGDEYFERKARERARFYNRDRTAAEVHRDRCEINEIINNLERR